MPSNVFKIILGLRIVEDAYETVCSCCGLIAVEGFHCDYYTIAPSIFVCIIFFHNKDHVLSPLENDSR